MAQITKEDLTGLAELTSEAIQTFNPVFYKDWCRCKIDPDFLNHLHLSEMKLNFKYLALKHHLENTSIEVSFYGLAKQGEKKLNCGSNPVSVLARRWVQERLGIKMGSFDIWKPTKNLLSVHIEPYDLESAVMTSIFRAGSAHRIRTYFTGFVGNPAVVYETRMETIPTVITTSGRKVKLDLYTTCHQRGISFTWLNSELIIGTVRASASNPWSGIQFWKREGEIFRFITEVPIAGMDEDTLLGIAEDCIATKSLLGAG